MEYDWSAIIILNGDKMTKEQCAEFNCEAYNSYDLKCLLSGKKIENEDGCSIYDAHKNRKFEGEK